MAATEELRQLLNESGIRWEAEETEMWFDGDKESHIVEFTRWKDSTGNTVLMAFWKDTDLLWEFGWEPTPKQAVEATLDRGTCAKVREWEDDPRGGGGWVLVCSACDEILANDGEDGEFDGPNFCPNCGRRVVRGEV